MAFKYLNLFTKFLRNCTLGSLNALIFEICRPDLLRLTRYTSKARLAFIKLEIERKGKGGLPSLDT